MKKTVVACLVSVLLLLQLVIPSFAASIKKNIEVTYNNIQIVIDGTRITPKDVNGNIVEPFIYNGTTYLPIRAVGEAMGKNVEWDPSTQTVYLIGDPFSNTTMPIATNPLSTTNPPITTNPQGQTGLHYTITNTQERIYESFNRVYWETLIEVTNTGTESIYFGLSNYDITDMNGKILKTGTLSSYPKIIYPGEKACCYDSVELAGATLDTRVNFMPRWDIKKAKENRINFTLSEIEIRDGRFGATIFGKIKNDTGKEQSWAIVSIILYSNDGTPIGVCMTNIFETMPIGTEFGFEISGVSSRALYDNISPDMVGYFIAYAYPPQYQF